MCYVFPLPWALAWRTSGSDIFPCAASGSGWRCVLSVDAGKSWGRRNCTTSVLASTSTKFKWEEIKKWRGRVWWMKSIPRPVFLALGWNSAEPSVSQKGPGKESCDLKQLRLWNFLCCLWDVFKQAWEDSASFLLRLQRERQGIE